VRHYGAVDAVDAAAADETLFDYAGRIRRAADLVRGAGADALVVTHLPNLLYLSGLDASSAVGLLLADARLYLLTDFRYSAAVARQAAHVGDLIVPIVLDSATWAPAVAARIAAEGVRGVMVEPESLTFGAAQRFEAACRDAGWQGGLTGGPGVVEGLRRVKDQAELGILREAGTRLSAVARGLLADRCVAAGRTEQEVAADVDHRMRLAGFSRPAFDTIVASGPNSALPHARPTRRRLAAGEPVVLDFGGVFHRYCVDLTRTLCVEGVAASAALDRMFVAVASAHAAALQALQPGADTHAVDAAAREVLEAAGLGPAFGHGTGHGLGLEVHEAPRIGKRRPDAGPEPRLTPGVVCTIEPGAYVPHVGGIRIEDDAAVTAAGHELLTDVPLGWPSTQ
jgi:Xaa-Pro aminopeptidase